MPVKRNLRPKLKMNAIKVMINNINPIAPKNFGEDSNSSKKDIYWL